MFRIEKVNIDGGENFYYEVNEKSGINSLPSDVKSTIELMIKAIEESANQVKDLYANRNKLAQNADKLKRVELECLRVDLPSESSLGSEWPHRQRKDNSGRELPQGHRALRLHRRGT